MRGVTLVSHWCHTGLTCQTPGTSWQLCSCCSDWLAESGGCTGQAPGRTVRPHGLCVSPELGTAGSSRVSGTSGSVAGKLPGLAGALWTARCRPALRYSRCSHHWQFLHWPPPHCIFHFLILKYDLILAEMTGGMTDNDDSEIFQLAPRRTWPGVGVLRLGGL